MSGWGGFGFSGALKNLSTTIFTENLADELEDPNPSHVVTSSSRVVADAPQGREIIGVADTPPPPPPPRNDKSSSDNLQQQMNDIIMNHPSIWQLYKKELSQATNPNDPLIVRNLFEEFLEKHHDEIVSQQQQRQQQNSERSSSSIFQKAFSGIQVAGLQEEEEEQQSHHHRHRHQDTITNQNTSSTSTSIPRPSSVIQSQPESQQDITEIDDNNDSNNNHNGRNIDYENMDPEEMQQTMKLAMSQPDLWAMYKKKLSQQPNKRHPETVRNVFVEFLKEHGHKLHASKGQQQQQKPPLSTSTSAAPRHSSKNRKFQAAAPTKPPPSSSSVSTTKQHKSLFNSLNNSLHELNMSLHEEQGRPSSTTTTSRKSRVQQQKNDNENKQEEQKRHRHDEEKQQQQHGTSDEMQLLRCHPTLYPQFQEDLQSTSMVADDFVTDFLKGHENELHEYEKQQQIEKQRRQEKAAAAAAAAKKASSQSIFQSLNMSMHEESMHYSQPQHHKSENDKKASSQSIFQSLNMSMHEESMHYSQPQHHKSEKDTKRVASAEEERKQHQQHERRQQQRRHSHQRQMYNKESISSRSARKLQVAMDSLAGEVEEGGNSSVVVVPPHPPQSVNENSDEHDGKSTRPNSRRRQMYNRESIASQSARKLKNAMDSLAGEMKEEEEEAGVVPPKSSLSGHGENMSRSSRRKMYHRESITSRSARQLQIAMDSLAGGMKEESAGVRSSRGEDIATSATRRHSSSGIRGGGGSFKPGEGSLRRPMMYQRESISSRSARSLKIAIDSLAGEVDDGTTTTVTKQQHRPEIIVDVSKKGADDHTRMQEVDLIGNGMGSDEILTSPSRRIRESIQTISNRFTTEMVGSFSKGLDLVSEVSPEGSSSRRRANTEEDLPTSADTDDDDRTFHKSCPIHFAPVVEEENDEDWVLSEASDIALRRRRNSHSISNKPSSSTALKTIIDINEREDDDNINNRGPMGKHVDDDDDGDRAVSTSSTLLSNSIKDPMTEVTAQGDDDAIATPSSKSPLQNEGNDNVVNTTKQSDELEASAAAAAENDDLDSDEGSLI